MVEFEESGMRFLFAAEKTYYIEKSDVYAKKLNGAGVSSVECVTLRDDLRASLKTSLPNPLRNII